jgi:glutamate-1-semialdehyde 2,1-aminomutase
MAAAAASLRELETKAATLYPHLASLGQRLMAGLRAAAASAHVPLLADGPGPVFSLYLTEQPAIRNYRDFARCDLAGMARLHRGLLDHGVNCVGRGLWFLSAAHTDADIDLTIAAFTAALAEITSSR